MNRTMLAAVCAFGLGGLAGGIASAEDALVDRPWDEIVAAARGGEVNWFLWGGADTINAYVSDYIGGRLRDEYGITLNRVPLTDTVEAVNIVLGEKAAGNDSAGSVDLIWINGENFRSMKEAGLVWCGYTGALPNNALVDWTDASVATDFGVPVDGCEVPWNRAQFAFAHDAAVTPDPPLSMAALLDWIRAHPGRFTYPAPPDFNGSAFVRQVFYHAAGGVDQVPADMDQAAFDQIAAKTWDILNGIEPFLWREGATYPTSVARMNDLFANGEVDFTFNYDPAQFGAAVDAGLYPSSVRSFGLTDGTLANVNYNAIPFNAANKAAALVLQNLLLSPEAQAEKARSEVWGAVPAIDMARVPDDVAAKAAGIAAHPSVVPPATLARHSLPELPSVWISRIEDGWLANVGR